MRATRRPALDLPRQPGHEPDGTPSYLTVGTDEPFDTTKLRRAVRRQGRLRRAVQPRLDELVAEGWLLADDADEMRREAEQLI